MRVVAYTLRVAVIQSLACISPAPPPLQQRPSPVHCQNVHKRNNRYQITLTAVTLIATGARSNNLSLEHRTKRAA